MGCAGEIDEVCVTAGVIGNRVTNHRTRSVGEIPGTVDLGGASITMVCHVLDVCEGSSLILKMLGLSFQFR